MKLSDVYKYGALSPSPGKFPIAAADGYIDPAWLRPAVNDIGTPGAQGFGAGVCPALPVGYSPMVGTADPASDNYGNYTFVDGSVMVWVPAFWYKVGSGANGLAVNAVAIAKFSAYATLAAADAAGYALHRAFFDGSPQPGFFVDKFQASNNNGVASSLKNGLPLSTAAAHNPISALIGTPSNTYAGTIAAAKTRGAAFHPCSQFIYGALALLSMAHGQASASATWCAWYDATGVSNFPKGNNNNALRDTNDASVLYVSDGYSNCGKTGSATPFAKTTHNGQACGVADLNGNMYEVSLGITCVAASKTITGITQANPAVVTVAAHGYTTGDVVTAASVVGMTQVNDCTFAVTVIDANTVSLDGTNSSAFTAYTSGGTLTKGAFYAAKPATRMRDFTAGNALATDHWGAVGVAALMAPLTPRFRTDYPNNAGGNRFGNGANQVLSSATSGNDWVLAGAGLPIAGGTSLAGSNAFGADYYYQYTRNELCLRVGAYWSNGSAAGVWAAYWYDARASSYDNVGFRAASYL